MANEFQIYLSWSSNNLIPCRSNFFFFFRVHHLRFSFFFPGLCLLKYCLVILSCASVNPRQFIQNNGIWGSRPSHTNFYCTRRDNGSPCRNCRCKHNKITIHLWVFWTRLHKKLDIAFDANGVNWSSLDVHLNYEIEPINNINIISSKFFSLIQERNLLPVSNQFSRASIKKFYLQHTQKSK